MDIVWASSRVFGSDLCSTSQINLANGLVDKGYNLRIYSPGKLDTVKFDHVSIKQSRFRGIQARSISRNIIKNIEQINSADIVLLDWTLWKIAPYLTKPFILVDRSPPAYAGFLAKLQWIQWKLSWKKTVKGTVVSNNHRNFVVEKTKTHCDKIAVIPAGVDLELFSSKQKSGVLKLVYHGRVDVNRGVMSLPMILAGLQLQGVEASLHIHGNGDAIGRLKNIDMDGLEVTEAVSQSDVASLLSGYDIGLLPMPENKVWNLASPLKRSEYLASGLVVCGIDHGGHQLKDSGEWLQLFSQKEFITSTVDWIKSLDRQSLATLQKGARIYAEENLSWSHSVDVLESIILS